MILENIVRTLDAHVGAIAAIAVIALVLSNIILAYVNLKLWRTQDKPLLYFYPHTKVYGGDVFFEGLYVKNIGKGPAFDINFDIVPINGVVFKYDVNKKNYQEQSFDLKEQNGHNIKLKFITSFAPDEEKLVFGNFTEPVRVNEIQIKELSYMDINGIRRRQKLQSICSWKNKAQ
jgi:hypothetical protein